MKSGHTDALYGHRVWCHWMPHLKQIHLYRFVREDVISEDERLYWFARIKGPKALIQYNLRSLVEAIKYRTFYPAVIDNTSIGLYDGPRKGA